jgi:ATP/maltotriose-dependent transcriptional regulator MalT
MSLRCACCSDFPRSVSASLWLSASPGGAATVAVRLSIREHELLALLSNGFSNEEIADRLDIAYQTVKVHMKHIYEKLHVRSRPKALLKVVGSPGTPAARPVRR